MNKIGIDLGGTKIEGILTDENYQNITRKRIPTNQDDGYNSILRSIKNLVLELAQESEMPRAYEVAGQLIKNVADATDKLLDLQKKLKDVEAEEKVKGPSTVNNALFVGSTADLAKMLKDGLKEDPK